jgi:peptide-methionine (R)-S-oxide reductase
MDPAGGLRRLLSGLTSRDEHGKALTPEDESYRSKLSPEQFWVTRQKGTEPPFSGAYWDSKEKGVYECVCCGMPLFSSNTKYDSGTGWPSFWEPIDPERINEETDISMFMVRTEIMCANCNAHLGHVFPDGPEPTGLRYCLNSASLKLITSGSQEQP